MRTSPRVYLDFARFAAAVLFWPILVLVVWGELKPDVPAVFQDVNDKFLHFSSYFILGALAGGAIKQHSRVKWAVVGLIVLGALLELIQAFVARDSSLFDAITNGAGVIAGVLIARLAFASIRMRWESFKDTPSEVTRR